MKGKIFVFLFAVFLLGTTFVSAMSDSQNMVVKVNVLQTKVGINVPDQVVFKDIAAGYKSERKDLNIKNTGTTDITVTPTLDSNDSGDVFKYLTFQSTVSADPVKVGFFDFDIDKPSVVGDTRDQSLYMYLDLTDYDGEIQDNLMDHNATVVFTAMPK